VNEYIGLAGEIVTAMQLTGPITVVTSIGEYTGYESQWLFYRENGQCEIVDNAVFSAHFTLTSK
jgi:hypothetical protein